MQAMSTLFRPNVISRSVVLSFITDLSKLWILDRRNVGSTFLSVTWVVLVEWSEGVDKLSVVTQGILPVGLLVASMVVGQVFTVEVVPEILRLISVLVSAESMVLFAKFPLFVWPFLTFG